ncbi:peptidoglycan-binding protein [Streptomyces sp. TS71-3]|uniref:peptidoglycan-binding protein n=1 Tax=Streptomyces sp. TS71-3 TaxID=2733862 RepID=UPI001BB460FF|nr:peptidoglycan-binding protein [Streptomyces sp. TS71-3]
MSRWKDLPDSLDESGVQLVVQLRRLKDRGGLSLSSLASKTGYSRSSWERYLNGKALPPRQAVEELARVGGTDPTRLLVLHEVAAEAWRGSAEAAHEDQEADRRERRRVRPKVLAGVGAAVVVIAVLAGLLVVRPWGDGGGEGKAAAGPAPSASAARGAFAFHAGKTYPCAVKRKNGLLYAGYSTTRTAILTGLPTWDVVEAQCLLKHHGFDPGAADGAVGDLTKRAVRRLQQKAHLPDDGIVGPQTWQVLRR